jgi:hypothetical protein
MDTHDGIGPEMAIRFRPMKAVGKDSRARRVASMVPNASTTAHFGEISRVLGLSGTKEENGIATTLALTYVKIRNTARDAYMSIQYTRAMVQTLEDQKGLGVRRKEGSCLWTTSRKPGRNA